MAILRKLITTIKGFDKLKSKCENAVTVVILNDKKEVLCVSRKDNHSDFGLVGGKVDETDISLLHAIQRETYEETGIELKITDFCQIYECVHGKYFQTTFIVELDYSPEINHKEEHLAKWGTWKELFSGSFGDYNILVKEKLVKLGLI